MLLDCFDTGGWGKRKSIRPAKKPVSVPLMFRFEGIDPVFTQSP